MRTLTVTALSYSEVERLVETHYGWLPELPYDNLWDNDSDHLYENVGTTKWYDDDELEEVRKGDEHNANVILETLAQDGHIDKGNYLIEVSW
jgi:hypothetical protein